MADDRLTAALREFRILALSGGGYLGLYSDASLAALEGQVGEPIGRRFNRRGRPGD